MTVRARLSSRIVADSPRKSFELFSMPCQRFFEDTKSDCREITDILPFSVWEICWVVFPASSARHTECMFGRL